MCAGVTEPQEDEPVENATPDQGVEKKRRRPDCYNRSAREGRHVNCLDAEGEDRPFLIPQEEVQRPKTIHYDALDSLLVEKTLVAKLQVDAAFQKRDESLLRLLKMKAQRYYAAYDTSRIPPEESTRMLIHSIAAAYEPSRHELIARRYLANRLVQHHCTTMNEWLQGIRPGLFTTLMRVGKANILRGRWEDNFA